jgi:hypothetical protein
LRHRHQIQAPPLRGVKGKPGGEAKPKAGAGAGSAIESARAASQPAQQEAEPETAVEEPDAEKKEQQQKLVPVKITITGDLANCRADPDEILNWLNDGDATLEALVIAAHVRGRCADLESININKAEIVPDNEP